MAKLTVTEFIRANPNLSADEVVLIGRKEGYKTLRSNYVHAVRNRDQKKVKGKRKRRINRAVSSYLWAVTNSVINLMKSLGASEVRIKSNGEVSFFDEAPNVIGTLVVAKIE